MNLPHTNLVLVGFMGSGKTSVGKLVSHRLGFQLIDCDAVVVERAGMEISDIFAQHGEPYFRDLESRALQSFTHLSRCVISTGGGAVLRESNRELLKQIGLVVLLTAREEILFDRVCRNTKRPLLRTADPRTTIHDMVVQRTPAYEAAAQVRIDTSDLNHDQAAEAVIAAARKAFGWE
jgi:shikimate kinase